MKQATLRKILSLLLVLAMVFSLFPVALAAEELTEGPEAQSVAAVEEIAGSEETAASIETSEEEESIEALETTETPESSEPVETDESPEIAENPEVAEAVETLEPTEPAEPAESGEEAEAEPEEEDAAERVLVLFVSGQELTLSLSRDGEVIAPVPTEETAEEAAEEESEKPAFSAAYLLEPGVYAYTAAAEGYVELSGSLEVTESTAWGETIELALEKLALPYGFAGMPEGYEFTEEELAAKRALGELGFPGILENMKPGEDYAEGVLLFKAGSQEYAELVAAAYSAELVSFNGHFGKLVLSTATVAEAMTAAADLALPLPAVEPNYKVFAGPVSRGFVSNDRRASAASEVPTRMTWADWVQAVGINDPLIASPEEYSDGYQWMHDMVNSYAAWGVTTGASNIVVAVIDSGVDGGHEDLQGALVGGYDFVDDDNDPSDGNGHGTHCAGIIGARMNNGAGGVGIAPGVSIMPVRVLDNQGYGEDDAIINGIYYAVDNGADIISMSLGGVWYSSMENDAVQYAIRNGVTLIAAMGNDGTRIMSYPAAYPNVISVGACDRDGKAASFSTTGSWMSVFAPGVGILSSVPGSGYEAWNGTSMATPVVAGVAALYESAYGHQSPATMAKVLSSATTGGVIDAAKLFSGDKPAPTYLVFDLDPESVGGDYQITERGNSSTNRGLVVPFPGETAIPTTKETAMRVDDSRVFVYTTDGKTPAVLNGQVRHGQIVHAYEGISLRDYSVGQTVTIKFMEVTGMGVNGKVTTAKIKILPATQDDVKNNIVVNLIAPQSLVAGKSAALIAELSSSVKRYDYDPETDETTSEILPYDAFDHTVVWSIVERQPSSLGAAINASTGALTTKAGQTGTVVVRAASKLNPEKYAEATIELIPAATVKSVAFLEPSATVYTENIYSLFDFLKILGTDGVEIPAEELGVKWTSSNKKTATVSADGELQTLAAGSTTVTALLLDGSGKKATLKLTVRQAVTSVDVTGQEIVAPGTSATFRATPLPKNASVKTVTWTLEDAPEGVTIDPKKGTVKVAANVPSWTEFTVTAHSNDAYGASASVPVKVMPRATGVDVQWAGSAVDWKYNKNDQLTEITLFSAKRAVTGEEEFQPENEVDLLGYRLYKNADGEELWDDTGILWSSSTPAVAAVDENGHVTALKGGTATITAKANDGSGKSWGVKVKVLVPASSIAVISKAPGDSGVVAFGKSVKNVAVLGNAYGKPSVSKVKWDWSLGQWQSDGESDYMTWTQMPDLEAVLRTKKLVTVNASGTLTVKAGAASYLDDSYTIEVRAETTDGTWLSNSRDYTPVTPIKTIKIMDFAFDESTGSITHLFAPPKTVVMTRNGSYNDYNSFYILAMDADGNEAYTGTTYGTYVVSTSNPAVAAGSFYWMKDEATQEYVPMLDIIASTKAGSAKITVMTTDGTGKKATINVKVK